MLTVTIDQTGTWMITGDFTIHNLPEMQDSIAQWLSGKDPVTINLEKVTLIDTAALQLLLSLKKYLKQEERPFKIRAGETVIKTMELLGLKKHLMDR